MSLFAEYEKQEKMRKGESLSEAGSTIVGVSEIKNPKTKQPIMVSSGNGGVADKPLEVPVTKEDLNKIVKKVASEERKIAKIKKLKQEAIRSLPKHIIPIQNADKENDEKWVLPDGTTRDPANFPTPMRAIFAQKVGSGKTSCIFNLILRQDPPFERIIIVHIDKSTKEYACLGPTKEEDPDSIIEMRGIYDDGDGKPFGIPIADDLNPIMKSLVILEDIPFSGLDKTQKTRLNRLYGYISSHKFCSVYSTCQNIFNIAPSVRRMSNVFFLSCSNDRAYCKKLASIVNMDCDIFMRYLNQCRGNYDNLCIDFTNGSPYKMRKNIFEIFDMNPGERGDQVGILAEDAVDDGDAKPIRKTKK